MTLFGIALSWGEIIALLTLVGSIIMAYGALFNKVSAIIARNEKADDRIEEFEKDFLQKIAETRAVLEARLVLAENRISGQEIRDARIDEKFNFMQGQLARLLDLIERDRNK